MSQQHTAAAGATDQRSQKRKLTKEELAAISRANGARSRGATSPEGAAKARRGNYKHGLACEVLAVGTEDAGTVARTVQTWYGHYRPSSPIAHTLVKICLRSDIMLDRCYTFLDTTTDGQGREVVEAWEEARTTLVADLVALLPTASDQAISKLKAFGHGCRWLLDEWSHHEDALLRYGYWPMEVWPDVVRLLSADPDFDRIGSSERAFLAALYNFQCQHQPAVAQIAALCAPHRRPVGLAQLRLPGALPPPEESRKRLRDLVATEIDELRRLEQALRLGKDRADLERVLKQTVLLNEDAPSRQFLRYHKEWCAQFFRASRVLPLALKGDAAECLDELVVSDEDVDAPPSADASEAAEGGVGAEAPPTPHESGSSADSDSSLDTAPAGTGEAPAPPGAAVATPGAEAVERPEAVAGESPGTESPSSALPVSAGSTVAEAAGAPDRVGFPDPPSCALPATADPAVAGTAGAPERVGFPDPPSSMPVVQTKLDGTMRFAPPEVAGSSAVPPGQERAVPSLGDAVSPAPRTPDRAPPDARGSPQSHDGGPRGVP
jgi:hypothetical protein